MHFAQDGLGMLRALAAVAADAQALAQILHRGGPFTGAIADLAFGDGVADADVHDGDDRLKSRINDNYYQSRSLWQVFFANQLQSFVSIRRGAKKFM